ncbi:hypothetical protein FGG78_41970 [Thioclava sp. BHET1]|nr:hypothetical protein FGG78_41970 [Thioclava sp. BHET1]
MAARALFHQADLPANAPRSVLRIMFLDPGARTRIENWEAVARILVSSFRRDTVRAGLSPEAQALIDELSDRSPDFRRLWTEQDVHGHGEGAKTLRHPIAGRMQLDYATFAVDGQPDLALVVFTPRGPEDRAALDRLIATPL